MKAKAGLPERVRSMEGLGGTLPECCHWFLLSPRHPTDNNAQKATDTDDGKNHECRVCVASQSALVEPLALVLFLEREMVGRLPSHLEKFKVRKSHAASQEPRINCEPSEGNSKYEEHQREHLCRLTFEVTGAMRQGGLGRE
ncbi:MAG: hypothetical protein ABI702_19405 [Burkholderiales bacterium]